MTEDDQIADSVARHGWHAIFVGASEAEPSLIYTIGLCHNLGHPEVVVFGLDAKVGHRLLCDLVDDLRAGKWYAAPGRYPGLLEGLLVTVQRVHASQHLLYLGYAMAFYRRLGHPEVLRTIQLLWPDSRGRAPADPNCDPAVISRQPNLEGRVEPEILQRFLDKYRPLN